jgi:hypothetical protein
VQRQDRGRSGQPPNPGVESPCGVACEAAGRPADVTVQPTRLSRT